jgi:DMSO/TMAO reductase YedYZ molybdopterin-dependent catalytic subunit
VEKWPVLSYGPTPRFNPATWDFRLFGLVEEPRRLNYQQFRALPQSRLTADFHCVTTWSRLDNLWEGVLAKDVVSLVRLKPAARYVMIHCDGGYTTNLSLDQLLDDDVLFAHRHDGRDLEPDHGWPLRLVVPKLYAWKSAKWVRGVEFLAENRRGFWEVRGYHDRGNLWNEERYSDQEEE